MISALVNRPNRVYEMQKHVQESHEPISYRLPRSHLYLKSYYTLFAIGMGSVVYASFNLIKGKST